MPTILVVDDDSYIADLLHDMLTDEGYIVHAVAHGHAALAHLAQAPVDLVLSDMLMPGMNGVALCQAIQGNRLLAHIPVVLMSAHSHFDRLAECTPQAVVVKPFDFGVLLRTVAEHIHH